MKFDYKNILIVVLLITTIILIVPRVSFADQMSPAPSPSTSAITCQTTPVPIASLCPRDYPRTGDMTPDGMKFCCK